MSTAPTGPRASSLARACAITFALISLLAAATATAAPRDRISPTTPTNLRVTGATAYSVSLAWSPSTRRQTVVYGTAGIVNTFEVVAVDEAGNRAAPATFVVDMR